MPVINDCAISSSTFVDITAEWHQMWLCDTVWIVKDNIKTIFLCFILYVTDQY